MLEYLIPVVVIPLSYAFGALSSARILAKASRSLNVDKVGSGLADTENIYLNVNKIMGILVGLIDVSKMYLYLLALSTILSDFSRRFGWMDFSTENWLLLFALFALIGHCLPMKHHFRGGRGVLTYMGIMLFFAFKPAIIASALALFFIFRYRQIRFAQYLAVMLPVLFVMLSNRFLGTGYTEVVKLFFLMVIMGGLNYLLSKRLGEF
jgi:glycerol-3-phosphate acyltransferase PlsY